MKRLGTVALLAALLCEACPAGTALIAVPCADDAYTTSNDNYATDMHWPTQRGRSR